MSTIETTVHDSQGIIALGTLVQCFSAKIGDVVPEAPHPMLMGSKPVKVSVEVADEFAEKFKHMAKTAGLIEEKRKLRFAD